MKQYLVAFFDLLLYSNLFIALTAVAFTAETMILLHIPLTWHPFLFITFFATLFDYSLHRLIGLSSGRMLDNDIWIKKHSSFFYGIFTISIIGLLISLMFANAGVIYFLIPMAVITMGYTLRVFRRHGLVYRLIDLPGAKIILLTSVWSLTTVLLPVIQAGQKIFSSDVLLLTTARWFFVFALAIPFDMRDKRTDAIAGLRTLPVMIGTQRSRYLSYVSLFLYVVFVIVRMCYRKSPDIFDLILLLSGLITFIVLRKSSTHNHSYYYYGLLDGMILLQAMLVFIAYLL